MTLITVTDAKGFITLHEPNEDGGPGDLVASVWRDDWLPALQAAQSPSGREDGLREAAQAVVDAYPVAAGTVKSLHHEMSGYGAIKRLADVLSASPPSVAEPKEQEG